MEENKMEMTENITEKKGIAKYRKAGWIATIVLTTMMVALLIAYIATGGTYGIEPDPSETTAAILNTVKCFTAA